jgi:hypothetical protein
VCSSDLVAGEVPAGHDAIEWRCTVTAAGNDVLSLWVIYDHPRDHPDHFVVRRQQVCPDGEIAASERLGFDMSRLERERHEAQKRVDVALAKLHESDATLAAVACVRAEPERRENLLQRVQQLCERVSAFATLSAPPAGAVVCLHLGEAALAARISSALAARGFRVPAIRPPTVPAGGARLRISLSASHRPEHVDALAEALAACWPPAGEIPAPSRPVGG